MAFPLLDVLGIGAKLIDKLIPDPGAKAAAHLELAKLAQSGELAVMAADTQLAQGQLDINKIEAASPSLFVSGWRPAMGWCCVAIFAANYVGVPILAWTSGIYHWPSPPRLDIGEVIPVLLGMLGLGALRTTEKVKGV
jgi:hypothetical protein